MKEIFFTNNTFPIIKSGQQSAYHFLSYFKDIYQKRHQHPGQKVRQKVRQTILAGTTNDNTKKDNNGENNDDDNDKGDYFIKTMPKVVRHGMIPNFHITKQK